LLQFSTSFVVTLSISKLILATTFKLATDARILMNA
jgi:hypothetical protein